MKDSTSFSKFSKTKKSSYRIIKNHGATNNKAVLLNRAMNGKYLTFAIFLSIANAILPGSLPYSL